MFTRFIEIIFDIFFFLEQNLESFCNDRNFLLYNKDYDNFCLDTYFSYNILNEIDYPCEKYDLSDLYIDLFFSPIAIFIYYIDIDGFNEGLIYNIFNQFISSKRIAAIILNMVSVFYDYSLGPIMFFGNYLDIYNNNFFFKEDVLYFFDDNIRFDDFIIFFNYDIYLGNYYVTPIIAETVKGLSSELYDPFLFFTKEDMGFSKFDNSTAFCDIKTDFDLVFIENFDFKNDTNYFIFLLENIIGIFDIFLELDNFTIYINTIFEDTDFVFEELRPYFSDSINCDSILFFNYTENYEEDYLTNFIDLKIENISLFDLHKTILLTNNFSLISEDMHLYNLFLQKIDYNGWLIKFIFFNNFNKTLMLFFITYYMYITFLKNYIFSSLNIFIYKIFNEFSNNILNKNSIKNILVLFISNFFFISIVYIFNLCITSVIYNIFIFFFLNIIMSFYLFLSFKTRILIIIKGFYNNFKLFVSFFYDIVGIFIFFSRFFLQSVRILSCMAFFYILNELNLTLIDFLHNYKYNIFSSTLYVREDFFLLINIIKSIVEYLDVVLSYTTNNLVFVTINI